jgi:hypothetical protein
MTDVPNFVRRSSNGESTRRFPEPEILADPTVAVKQGPERYAPPVRVPIQDQVSEIEDNIRKLRDQTMVQRPLYKPAFELSELRFHDQLKMATMITELDGYNKETWPKDWELAIFLNRWAVTERMVKSD